MFIPLLINDLPNPYATHDNFVAVVGKVIFVDYDLDDDDVDD